jgi:hypothetical protein
MELVGAGITLAALFGANATLRAPRRAPVAATAVGRA